MDKIHCTDCEQTFRSKYNLFRHVRNKHSPAEIPSQVSGGTLGVHLGAPRAPPPGAHLGAPKAPPPGAPYGTPGAHLGAPGAPYGAPGAHYGPPRAPLGALEAPLGAPYGAPGAHLGARGANFGAQHGAYFGEKSVILQHPFTMMISGPTACGKTTFVKDLLQHNATRIEPTLQRIVWLYKRWQPLYSAIQVSVIPRVEFIHGIPRDLDDDDFFDPSVNNLLVLDDLFSEAGKDKRINDLFTEGSHHRSLSVICINQNLFGTKDPTQRRNCHYLVLFNNPVDCQAMMTLARQMYPGRSQNFMNTFAKATKQPYGFLLVDLKPFTPENERLNYKITWYDDKNEQTNQNEEPLPSGINTDTTPAVDHSSTGVHTVNIEREEQEMSDKMNACDDCGLLFDTAHDVLRHVKRGWCAESQEPPAKKHKIEQEANESETLESVEDNDGYHHLWELAKKDGKSRFNELYDRYVAQGEKEEDASDMAEERTKPFEEKRFLSRYSTLLETYWLPLQDSALHNDVLRQIKTLSQKGVPVSAAVRRVLRKYKTRFEELFDTEVSDQGSDDETADSGDDDVESDVEDDI